MNDELACASLMLRASYYADMHRIEDFVSLFAEDGAVDRMGDLFEGPAQIRAFMEGRNRDRVTRHVVAAPMIDLLESDEAEGIGQFVLYDGTDPAGALPLPITLPATVGEFRQTYRRVGGEWKIVSHSSAATFRRTGKASA